jgi:hypothetical protein
MFNKSVWEMESMAKSPAEAIRLRVAGDRATPRHVQFWLAIDPEAEVRARVAQITSGPELVFRLAQDKHWKVRTGVAKNKHASDEVLAKLAGDDDNSVRYWVAHHPNATLAILTSLRGDVNAKIRGGVAMHKQTPPEILAQLAEDEDEEVRAEVAARTDTPPETLNKLAGDCEVLVRHYAALNLSTPSSALIRLAKDKYEGVYRAAKDNLAARGEVIEKVIVQYRKCLTGNVEPLATATVTPPPAGLNPPADRATVSPDTPPVPAPEPAPPSVLQRPAPPVLEIVIGAATVRVQGEVSDATLSSVLACLREQRP